MKTRKTDTGIAIEEMMAEEAGLMMTAVLQMAEEADRAGNHNHARILRRAGMQIDKCLPKK
ncbi:MAG: hypothetical protein U0I70_02890 [Alistipes inops]|jgi:hypothetical protein|nr:hypothetical protein [Alistipes inops]DAT87905.1 MAG TPA: hypothetical protein [Caudoviricetes sp.]